MTEQHHSSNSSGSKEPNEKYVLPASILVAAVLISGSMLYSTNRLTNSPSFRVAGSGGDQQLLGEAAVPNREVPAPGTLVDVPERENTAVLGDSNAEVTIVEFSDFQCPFCQRFYLQAYQDIKDQYVDSGQAKFEYRHFPLSSHQNARQAAIASECASRQGQFFPYHDLLFENMQSNGSGLEIADLKDYAVNLGLNTSEFNQCLDNEETADIVEADFNAGVSLGVNGTPTLFINGVRVVGAQPFVVFQEVIEAALEE